MKKLGVDLENLLLEQSESDLRSLLNGAIKVKSKNLSTREAKGLIVHMLLDDENFSTQDLVNSLGKGSTRLDLARLLEEPRNEKQMEKAVKEEFRGDKCRIATEVPIPRESGKPPRIDVAVQKKGFLGSTLYAFELKKSKARGEIIKAFGQAQLYTKYCDQVYVGLTPLTYLKQSDEIARQMKEHKELGVWIVNSRKKIAIVNEAYAQPVDSADREKIIKFMEAKLSA